MKIVDHVASATQKRNNNTMDVNSHGGYYKHGARYTIEKRLEVIQIFLELQQVGGDPNYRNRGRLCTREVAEMAKVSISYAYHVISEYMETGGIKDTEVRKAEVAKIRQQYTKIGPLETLVLLSLRSENDQMLLVEYKNNLRRITGANVSVQTIDYFFKHRFDYRGSLRKASLVPVDKWKEENIARYHEFMETIAKFPDHSRYHFIDEKHFVNKDAYNNKVRVNPLDGSIRAIPVSGNFRDPVNMIAIIRCCGWEPAMHYTIGKENGTTALFTAYIEHLLAHNWFQEGDLLIMNNAAIHTGAEASHISDLLFSYGVLVVPLPTRAPELNPIELCFHIIARHIRKAWGYGDEDMELSDMTVEQQVHRVVAEHINCERVLRCAAHCGY